MTGIRAWSGPTGTGCCNIFDHSGCGINERMASRSLEQSVKGLGKRKQLQLVSILETLEWAPSMEIIEALYQCSDEMVKCRAIDAAAGMKSRRAEVMVHRVALNGEDGLVRHRAIFHLGLMGDKHFETLRGVALDHREPDGARDQATDAIGDMFCFARRRKSYPAAVELLIEKLKDPCPEVRWTACFALGKIRAKAALPALNAVAVQDTGITDYGPVAAEAKCVIDYLLRKAEIFDVRDLSDNPNEGLTAKPKAYTNSYFPGETRIDR